MELSEQVSGPLDRQHLTGVGSGEAETVTSCCLRSAVVLGILSIGILHHHHSIQSPPLTEFHSMPYFSHLN